MLQALGEPEGLFWALQQQGELALYTGNYAVDEQHFCEVAAHWRQLDTKLNLAWALALVGEATALQGNLLTAANCYTEAQPIFREPGHKDGEAIVSHHRGEIARCQDNLVEAKRFYQESITLCQPLQNRHITARGLAGLAGVALAAGQTTVAATLLGAAQRLFDELAPFLPPAAQAAYEELRAATRQTLGESAYATHWQTGYAITTAAAVTLALTL